MGAQRHTPAALPPGKRPGTLCVGSWGGPRAGLDESGKSRPLPRFDTRIVQPRSKGTIPTELSLPVSACRLLAIKWSVTASLWCMEKKHNVFRLMFSEKAVFTSSEMACTEYQVRTFMETAAPTTPRPGVSPDLFVCVYRPTRLRSCGFLPCRLVGKYERFGATYCLDVLPL